MLRCPRSWWRPGGVKYVYCLVADVRSSENFPPGVTGAKVYSIRFRGLTALVSDIRPDSLASTTDQVVSHGDVVKRAWGIGGSVIPCRFGTILATPQELRSFLKHHYSGIQECLNKLTGRVEVGVKALFDDRPMVKEPRIMRPGGLPDGERYLLEKRGQYKGAEQWRKKAEEFSRALNLTTGSLWVDMKVEKRLTDKGLVLSFCYLLDREKLSSFREAYLKLRKQWAGTKLLYSGPWPPYSFASIDLTK